MNEERDVNNMTTERLPESPIVKGSAVDTIIHNMKRTSATQDTDVVEEQKLSVAELRKLFTKGNSIRRQSGLRRASNFMKEAPMNAAQTTVKRASAFLKEAPSQTVQTAQTTVKRASAFLKEAPAQTVQTAQTTVKRASTFLKEAPSQTVQTAQTTVKRASTFLKEAPSQTVKRASTFIKDSPLVPSLPTKTIRRALKDTHLIPNRKNRRKSASIDDNNFNTMEMNDDSSNGSAAIMDDDESERTSHNYNDDDDDSFMMPVQTQRDLMKERSHLLSRLNDRSSSPRKTPPIRQAPERNDSFFTSEEIPARPTRNKPTKKESGLHDSMRYDAWGTGPIHAGNLLQDDYYTDRPDDSTFHLDDLKGTEFNGDDDDSKESIDPFGLGQDADDESSASSSEEERSFGGLQSTADMSSVAPSSWSGSASTFSLSESRALTHIAASNHAGAAVTDNPQENSEATEQQHQHGTTNSTEGSPILRRKSGHHQRTVSVGSGDEMSRVVDTVQSSSLPYERSDDDQENQGRHKRKIVSTDKTKMNEAIARASIVRQRKPRLLINRKAVVQWRKERRATRRKERKEEEERRAAFSQDFDPFSSQPNHFADDVFRVTRGESQRRLTEHQGSSQKKKKDKTVLPLEEFGEKLANDQEWLNDMADMLLVQPDEHRKQLLNRASF